jgi:hypothetical protein
MRSTWVKRLKLEYGAMPPEDITLMYAAAKGISRSKLEDLSLALFIGTTIKPAITKSGRGTKIKRGKNPVIKARTTPIIDTGRVSIAERSINEM